MIDRIQGSHYYNQNTSYEKKVKSNTETFSMDDYRRESAIESKEKEKEKPTESAIEHLWEKEEDGEKGVHLELSADNRTQQATQKEEPERLFDFVSSRFKTLWNDLKAAFLKFLKGDAADNIPEDEVDTGQIQRSEQKIMEPEPVLNEAQQLKRSLSRAEEAYREYAKMQEEKSLAKNSDLLTTYNKKGSIVHVDAAEKNRILHAHPHQIDETF